MALRVKVGDCMVNAYLRFVGKQKASAGAETADEMMGYE